MSAKQRKTLSGRLFAVFFSLSLGILLVGVTAVVAVSWMVYEGAAEQRLSTQTQATASLLSGLSESDAIAYLQNSVVPDTRITLVAGDGRVVYDSQMDAADMPNHATRGEIVAARDEGVSSVLRHSDTTGSDTLYVAAAVPQSDYVIRFAEVRASLSFYLSRIAAPLAVILALALPICLLLARMMARAISAPLVDVDLEDPLACDAYTEVMPLLQRVDAQKAELVEKNEKLQAAVEARREFTGNVSHEMKSPLQVIGGYAELIEGGVATGEDARRFAGLISSEATSMRMLIDDVLVLSKLDEMQVDRSTSFDMAAACGSAIARLEPAAQERGMRVTQRGEASALVRGSVSLAEQMVYNLVDNAIRYGRQGGLVEVDLAVSGGSVRLAVSDDGPGVSPDQRDRIFERFYRADASRSRETGGTGLGLAIVKHAAISMGGSVRAEESSARGLAVVVDLPLAGE